jgi:hypothetical protein
MVANRSNPETADLWLNLDKFEEKKAYNRKLIDDIENEIESFTKDLAEVKRI